MSSRTMAMALAAALITPVANAAVVAKLPAGGKIAPLPVIDVGLPTVGVAVGPTRAEAGAAAKLSPSLEGELNELEARSDAQPARDGAVTYSYLPRTSSAAGVPGLGPLVLVKRRLLDWPAAARETPTADTTYTVVEGSGMRRAPGAIPAMALLFASALCGLGGLAWWRRQHRAGI